MRDEELARQAEFLHHDLAIDIGIFEHIEPPRGFMGGTIAHREFAVARATLAWDIMRAAACHFLVATARFPTMQRHFGPLLYHKRPMPPNLLPLIFPDSAKRYARAPLKTTEGHHTVAFRRKNHASHQKSASIGSRRMRFERKRSGANSIREPQLEPEARR